MDSIDRLSELEAMIAYRAYAPNGVPAFQIEEGTVPVLVSAPHATAHLRDGQVKMEEEFTAGVARYLAQETGCRAIFGRYQLTEDPNWDQASCYKSAVRDFACNHDVKLIIDLHGMTGVALGTMNGRSLDGTSLDLTKPFLENGFEITSLSTLDAVEDASWKRLVLNHPKFTGGIKSHTITRFSTESLGIAAVQVELTSAARIVYRGPNSGWPFEYWGDKKGISSTLNALVQLVRSGAVL